MCNKLTFEPRHDKTNKVSVRPAKTQISLRVFAVRMKKAWVLSYPLSAQRRLWSDWADAQADLSLRWAHTHFVGFVMSRLIFAIEQKSRSLPNRSRTDTVHDQPGRLLTENSPSEFKFLNGYHGMWLLKRGSHELLRNCQRVGVLFLIN